MLYAIFVGLLLLALGLPIAFVLGGTGVNYFIFSNYKMFLNIVPMRIFTGLDNFTIMAVPFFILAGEIMNKSGITDRLVKFAQVLIGRIRGGLAYVNILSSFLFAGISGAAISDVSSLGSIFIPAMERDGYDTDFSAAVTAASSIMGPIIPPSIIIVIYSAMTGTSIRALFAGALIPGALIGLSNSFVSYYTSKKRNYPVQDVEVSIKILLLATKDALLALIMPIIIIGGILIGVVTPTEAAAIAVLYALLIGVFVFKTIKMKDLITMLFKTALTTSMLFLIISMANIFGWIMGMEEVPILMANFFSSVSNDPRIILLLVNAFLLFMGTFMETGANVILFAPILAPLMAFYGVDPVHFGIVMIVNLNIGLITPPLGVCLFAACSICDTNLENISREIFPFLFWEILVLFTITYFPQTVLFIPRLLGY